MEAWEQGLINGDPLQSTYVSLEYTIGDGLVAYELPLTGLNMFCFHAELIELVEAKITLADEVQKFDPVSLIALEALGIAFPTPSSISVLISDSGMRGAEIKLVFETKSEQEPAFYNTTFVTLSVNGTSCYID